ncbi:unnamed protein product [Rotaria socialis]|uniref:Uncharacterized protein n=1 Tax=Rotaria socialis TaxID=392032 RepID=A0A821GQD2_9BILA|nr:unnamed protein product [Rotaria socialis]
MKIRRKLCANSNVPLKLPIHFNPLFKELFVGCNHTPQVHGRLCTECKDQEVLVSGVQRYTKKQEENARRRLKTLQKTLTNDMGSLSCNVHKEDTLIDASIRACGILVIATSCQVIIAFEEILRSKSKKQVLQALRNVYTITPMLIRIIIYDTACLLAKYVRSNFDNESKRNEFNNTIGMKILKEVRFFVDRFHLTNHVDKYSHEHLNLDLHDSLRNINSS